MKKINQFISFMMSLFVIFCSIFMILPIAYADSNVTLTVTGDEVNFRTGAGVENSAITLLYSGYTLSLLDSTKHSGSGCSSGWYYASYNGSNGYVCSSYVTTSSASSSASYGRPWTSPKKAILGGAEFIASGYISEGQNTIYLKKFNVNPSNTPYTHQYQANISAPCSEALSSYYSYRDNNLLSLPLHFVIPIYNNMPDYTVYPVTGNREVGGTSTVTDQAFEDQLNSQGFPESYKVWLRALHNTYSNWTFEAMNTGLDFTSSVNSEQLVGAVTNTKPALLNAVNYYGEAGWATPNYAAMAYFLDPRNFLDVTSVLMFEDLGNNANYTENTVQSVLSGTFMAGCDNIDHVTYSSMFMEAGKTYDVSPIYLASLSKQEVGTVSGAATNGEQFTYNGNTYIGFYNFYNIGANSGVYQGLAYAAAGATKNSEGIYVGSSTNSGSDSGNSGGTTTPTEPTTPTATPVATHLSNMGLNKKGSYITNLSLNTTVGTLRSRTNSSEVTIKNASGNVLGDTEIVSTGDIITFSTGESDTIVIYGDITGDGKIDGADLLMMRQYLLGQVNVSSAQLEAAHVYTTFGSVNGADLLKLRQHLLGISYINQA